MSKEIFIKRFKEWDVKNYLKTNEDRVNYLEAALEENDKELVVIALLDIAESLDIGWAAIETARALFKIASNQSKMVEHKEK
jgi:DNA-binding phage protein